MKAKKKTATKKAKKRVLSKVEKARERFAAASKRAKKSRMDDETHADAVKREMGK